MEWLDWAPDVSCVPQGTLLGPLLSSCAVSVSNTGKHQFTAIQSIYQLSDKDRSVPNDL